MAESFTIVRLPEGCGTCMEPKGHFLQVEDDELWSSICVLESSLTILKARLREIQQEAHARFEKIRAEVEGKEE